MKKARFEGGTPRIGRRDHGCSRGQGLLVGWQRKEQFKSEKYERASVKSILDGQKEPADNAWGPTERAPTIGRGLIVRKMDE